MKFQVVINIEAANDGDLADKLNKIGAVAVQEAEIFFNVAFRWEGLELTRHIVASNTVEAMRKLYVSFPNAEFVMMEHFVRGKG